MSVGIIKNMFRAVGLDIHRYYPPPPPHLNRWRQIVHHLADNDIEILLDVGANTGQFAEDILRYGYDKRIISFEPLSTAHSQLQATSAETKNWDVYERSAIGASEGCASINIADNSHSSSLLGMTDTLLRNAPQAEYISTEMVKVISLDSLRQLLDLQGKRLALKIDAQGFEGEILKGAASVLEDVNVIFTEMGLVELYKGQTLFFDLYKQLLDLGFDCYALYPGFTSSDEFRVLELDGLFVRKN